jgi:hypothetical protein
VKEVKLTQSLKVPSGIDWSGQLTVTKWLQPEKSRMPVCLTLAGTIIEVSAVQFSNTPRSIVISPSGRSRLPKATQLLKA